ncbi:MAG: AI-2E family transporter [Coriobacteriia bacterium]|nr:AI-2E family transporter [Coriobacteriia bacterium]
MRETEGGKPRGENRLTFWALATAIVWFVVGFGLILRSFGQVLGVLIPALTSFLFAGLLVAMFRPVTHWLKRRKVNDGLAALGGVACALVVIGIGSVIVLGPVLAGANSFVTSLPTAAANLSAELRTLIANTPVLSQAVRGALESSAASLVSGASRVALGGVGILVKVGSVIFSLGLTTFLALILAFWFLKDGPHISKAMLAVVPARWREDVSAVASAFDTSFSGYLIATAINCSLIFVLDGIGFSLVGLPNPWLFAAMDALVGVIPYVGSILSFVVAVVVGLAISPAVGIGTGVVHFAVDQIVYSFIGPVVAGKTVSLHPVMIIFALSVGAALAGIWGALLAIPVAAAIRVIFIYYRDRDGVQVLEAQGAGASASDG